MQQPYHTPSPGGAPPQWSNNPPPTSQAPPQSWGPAPPNGHYSPRSNQVIPPITQAIPQAGAMQTLQPQHPDQYRALPPPPQGMYPPYHPQMGYAQAQPQPRQRTAIACRYCRRRKIRCSGFDTSEDGRCSNCQRFSQECVFTPVHAQTQAFVPAHSVYRGGNPPPNAQLYGAYGQPLPAHGDRSQYPPQGPGQYPPPPQGYQQPPMYQQVPPQQAGQKRGTDEPHTPTLPPPGPGGQPHGQSFGYPDPSALPAGASPASSNASLNPLYTPQHYYAPSVPVAHRASPQGVYPYEAPMSQQQQAQAAAMQALAKQEERTTTDSKQGDTTNGAATDGARKEGGARINYVDAGVQVELIGTSTAKEEPVS